MHELPDGYVYARLDDPRSIFAGAVSNDSPEYLLGSEVFPTKEALRKAYPTPRRGYYLAKIANNEIHYLEGPNGGVLSSINRGRSPLGTIQHWRSYNG
jgi:hypothetical protein